MSSVTTTVPYMGTTLDPLSYCFEVFMEKEQDTFDKDWMSIGIGFAVAFVVGGLVAAGCSRLCFKDITKHKLHNMEEGYMEENHIAVHEKHKLIETHSSVRRRKRTKPGRGKGALRKGSAIEEEPLLPISPIILDGDEGEGSKGKGLLDALVKDSGAEMEAELSNQDIDAISRLEKEFREQNIDTMMQLLRTLLNKHLKNGKLTTEQSQQLMKNAQENLDSAIKTCQAERDEEEEQIRNKIKDKTKLEGELDKLNTKYNNKLGSMVQAEKERFRQDLAKNTDLSDSEIDNLMAELTKNMANLEHRLGVERLRQAAALEERLAKRRQLAQMQRDESQQQIQEVQFRTEAHGAALDVFVKDGKLMDRQKEELLAQYNEDLRRIQLKNQEDFQRQKLTLAEKLRQRREKQTAKLRQEHDSQKEEFLKMSDRSLDTQDLVESYHQMLQQQREEEDDINDQLDDQEADEIRKLFRSIEKQRNVEVMQHEEQFEDQMRSKAQLNDKDVDRLMALHQQQMEEYNEIKKADKMRQRAVMEEKLQRRRMQVEEEQVLALAEQAALKEQQDATIDKVLHSQVELDPGDKDKILKEHEQNMTAVNNQLQMSRLKQQKQLEGKLNQRRAKVEDMKRKVDEAKMERKKDKQKHVDQLQKDIDAEEQRIEEDKKKALAEVRERIAKETEEALAEQEKQLGLLIARLQVGQARRQALISRQDKTIKDLEDKVANRLADKVEGSSSREEQETSQQVDYLLQTHMNQVSNLNDKLQDVKQQQNQMLQEKLQQKKLRKEREIENNLEQEAQSEFQEQKRRGTAGLATALLGQTMLESRHKMAMNQLEHEMQAEMQKQREELNAELEQDLQAELEEQKKTFLAQLAAVSNMSKDDINDLVENAVADTGGDYDQAKKLSKDMRIEMKKAKNDLGIDDRPASGYKKDRRRSSVQQRGYENNAYDDNGYDEPDYEEPRRPKSSMRRKSRPSSGYNEY